MVELDLLHVGQSTFATPVNDATSHWSFRNVIGDAADCIADASRRADLIVMTTGGRCGALEAFIGSTAERVVAQAKCPVLTVPTPSG